MLPVLWFFFFARGARPSVSPRRYTVVARWPAYLATLPATRYLVTYAANRMPGIKAPAPLDAGVPQTVTFDAGLFLPPGVTLTGTPTVALTVAAGSTGTDSNPQSRVTIAPEIGTAPAALGGSGVANAALLVQFTLLGGVTYLVWLECARSDGTDIVSIWCRLSCSAPN